ncbi:hypothetical protein LGH74_14220 [Hymenobacter sp. BT178]|uniref:HTH cro/C1-type domain-containing protein n=1 Tax=Hymenobacter lucidus TaxID=2880930 RepID=A0ABS8AVI2_9BACT|nr:hypothetical protein [Hymenobacter lucidus]
MPRRSIFSSSLSSIVRAHFSLTQAELARFLDVSRSLVSEVEAGRRDFADAPRHKLWVLARYLPPPDGQGPTPPPFATSTDPDLPEALATDLPGSIDQESIETRLRRCRFYAVKLRFQLGQLKRPTQNHARRLWALEVLRTALAPHDPMMSTSSRMTFMGATPDPVEDLLWLERLTKDTSTTPPPLTTTERFLLFAKLRGLEAEIKALEEI